jgi:hypothetical protein
MCLPHYIRAKYKQFGKLQLSHHYSRRKIDIILRTTKGWTVLEEEEYCENVRGRHIQVRAGLNCYGRPVWFKADASFIFILFGCIAICSRSRNGDGPIVGTLVVSSAVKIDVNWSLRMLTFSRLPLWVFPPLVNGTTPVESHLLPFMTTTHPAWNLSFEKSRHNKVRNIWFSKDFYWS